MFQSSLAGRAKILLKLTMKEIFSRARICGVQEFHVTSYSIYSQARLSGMGADHPSTHTNCQRGEK